MNRKHPLTSKTAENVISSILNKIDKAEANDIYYLCIAIGQALGNNNIQASIIPSDVYYAIYLKQIQMVNEYDLYQLSQIAMALSPPGAAQHVPDSYWTECLVQALKENVNEFK